jgi:CcmD family protein
VRRWLTSAAVLGVTLWTSAGTLLSQQPQDTYQPVRPGELQESLPATPLVFAAYAFVWVALIVYVFVLWKRLTRVERELADVTARFRATKHR